MPRKIGPTIGIDGEKEYRAAIQQIIQQGKTLDAEMKQVASSFKDDADAKKKSAAIGKELEKSIANQKQYIAELAKMVERSAKATTEDSKETLQWKEALANAQTELNRLEGSLDDTTQKTSIFGETLKASLVADAIKAGVKATVDGIVQIGKAAASFGKEVVMSFADFEQLEGGVQKLFGADDARQVIKNAENAFKTAGLSANEYMETVTGFSAALINSLGGDTAKAAELADVAIRDMSDNANTFGTDMQSLQNAYAGFAKGQFNMLDNLKLGYAGSKEGMEQLLADAEAISGVKFNIDSYADIVQAINVVQENMGIAGTTAREAAGTISGSIDSLKSAFKNFVTGLGQDGADIDMLFGNMVESFQNVVANVQPVVERLIDYLPGVVANLLPVFSAMLPELTAAAGEMFNQIVTTVLALLPQLTPVAVQAITTIVEGLVSNLPLILDAAVSLIFALVDGIADALPVLVEQAPVIVVQLIDGLLRALPRLVQTGANLVGALVEGIISFAGGITEAALQIRLNIATAFDSIVANAKQWGMDMIVNFANGIAERASAVFNNVIELAKGVTQLLHFSEPDKGPMANFHTWAPDMMKLYAKGIRDNAYRVEDAVEAAAMGVEVGLNSASAGASQNAYNYGGISLVVNQQPGQSTEALVDEIMFRIQDAVDSRRAVFAS